MNVHSCKHDKEWVLRCGAWYCELCNIHISHGEMLLLTEVRKLREELGLLRERELKREIKIDVSHPR